jgi:hypothetical protein
MALMDVPVIQLFKFFKVSLIGEHFRSGRQKANSIPNILRGGAETIGAHNMGQLKSKFKWYLPFGGDIFSVSNPVLVLTE